MRHAMRQPDRVLHGQEPAPGVAEQGNRFEPELLAYPVEVLDLTGDADGFRRLAQERPAAAPLVVVDEAERLRQPIHLGQQVLVIEIGSSVHDDDRHAMADLST